MDQFNIFGEVTEKDPLLRDKFIEPPFSVLDTKSGNWQRRKRLWKSLGIKSEEGRDVKTHSMPTGKYDKNNMEETFYSKEAQKLNTSIFDPALCEVLYHWFCKEGGKILDPFAGGSVRGIVANYLGYKYTGIDIRPEQVESNRKQGIDILPLDNQPNWIVGDSDKVLDTLGGDLTPFQIDSKGIYLKREDYAGFTSEKRSSGTKVRAFKEMIESQRDAEYLSIGCSADSLMQVYVTEMAEKYSLKSKVFIPKRKEESKMTKYAKSIGGDIEELPYPCYPAHYRKAFREYCEYKKVVKWNPRMSTLDSMLQVFNLPREVKRIVIPTGSGAIAVGVICGLMRYNRLDVEVILVKVSEAFGGRDEIINKVSEEFKKNNDIKKWELPKIEVIPPKYPYGTELYYKLEDGSELDPVYSAKAYEWIINNPKENTCLWISGRRPNLKLNYKEEDKFDFVFSCPPYADLEVYSDLEGDISNMDYKDFMTAYDSIIKKSCRKLKKGGYACFVVGEVRDKKGNYISFVPDTINSFIKAGLNYYNEGILLNAIASASMRADRQFSAAQKLVKVHQNVLVFKKD